jgi:hypothetical protein
MSRWLLEDLEKEFALNEIDGVMMERTDWLTKKQNLEGRVVGKICAVDGIEDTVLSETGAQSPTSDNLGNSSIVRATEVTELLYMRWHTRKYG